MEEQTGTYTMLEGLLRKLIAEIESEEDVEVRKSMIEDLEKLYKVKIDADRSVWESDSRYTADEADIKERKKERYFRLAMFGIELLTCVVSTSYWLRMGYEFEEKGAVTSFTFKDYMKNKPKPFRR